MKAKNIRYSALSSILPAFILIAGSVALAAPYQWDPNDSTAGLGGTGAWDTTSLFWDALGSGADDGSDTTVAVASWNPATAVDSVTFGGSAGTVTLGAAVNVLGTSFSTTGYTLNLTNTAATNYKLGTLSGDVTINVTLGSGTTTADFVATDWSGYTGILNVGVSQAAGSGKAAIGAALGKGLTSSASVNVTANSTLYSNGLAAHAAALTLNGGDTGETLGQLRLDGGGTWSGGITLAGAMTGTDNFIGTNSGPSFITGIIGESGGSKTLSKGGAGTLILSGANTYTGGSILRAGTLAVTSIGNVGGTSSALGTAGSFDIAANATLSYWGAGETTDRVVNFSTSSGGIVSNDGAGPLVFSSNMTAANAAMGVTFTGGGNITIQSITGNSNTLNFVKTGPGTLTVNGNVTSSAAASDIRAQGGVLSFASTATTSSNSTMVSQRSVGGILRVASGASVKTNADTNTNGIMGGWAVFNGTDWAQVNGAGTAISAYAGGYVSDTWASGNNTDVTTSSTPASGSTTNSLRFNAAAANTLTLAGANTIESGGILVTSNVGANNTSITGGTLAGANTKDLVIHQLNTGGTLTIGSIIANNTGATALTVAGPGTTILSSANTYTGTTYVLGGAKLTVNANSGGKIYNVSSDSTLELGYSPGTAVYNYGVSVYGAGTAATTGLYLAGGKNFNFQSTLTLKGGPTTVRGYGTGNAKLYGYDTNGTHLSVDSSASGSVIDNRVDIQSSSYGYVMNIAPGLNTAAGDLTIQGAVNGSPHVIKKGNGSVKITGAGGNTGPFEVWAGTTILSGGTNRLGSGSSMILGNGTGSGRLILDGIAQTFTALTTAGTGTDNRVVGGSATLSTLTINNSGDTTIAAHLGGTGANQNNFALTKSGIGVLTLSGSNLFAGNSTINAGSLRLDYSTNDNSKLSDTGTLTLGGNLILNGGSHVEIVGNTVITGTVGISRVSGSAAIDLGTLSRTGSATLNLATADIARTNTPNDPTGRLPSWITIDGSPASNDGNGNIVVFVPTFVDVIRLGGTIPNNSAANVRIVDGGSFGTVTPAASGLTDILSLTQNATGGPATVSLGESDTLRLGEFGTITATSGAGSLTLLGGTLTAGGADDTPGTLAITGEAVVTIDSILKDNGTGPLSVIKSGPGSLTLAEMNDHTGGITLNAGQLMIGDPYSFGYGGTFTINGGAFDNSTGEALTISDSIPQIWGGDFTFIGSHDLTFQSGGVSITANREVTVDAATLEIKGAVGGSGGFTKLGGGSLILSGSGNNWTGSTTVSGGALEILSRAADGPYVVNTGTTLRLGYVTGGGYASTSLKLHGDGVAATTGLYLKAGASYNASGGIELLTAPTTIHHYGEGLAAIGMFDINGNGLSVSAAASGSVIDGNIQLVSRGYGMSMIVTAGTDTATGDIIVNGPLNVANGGLYKRGTGSVRLNGVATAGNLGVQIQGGRVITGVANALGANAILPITAGAVLDLNGFDQEASSLSGGGSVVNGGATAATLKINQATEATFSGVLGGATTGENNFAFVKSGTAALTLSGSNTYTGDTTLAQGTLTLGQPFLADTSAVRVSTGATLALSHGQADTVAELWIDGVQQPVGTYTSVNAAFITGSGSLVVTSGPSGDAFASWATSKGLDGSPGKEAGFDADPDGDGADNGLEWILGGEPLDGKSLGLVTSTATAGGGLTLTFTRNEDSVGQATLTVEYNGTLANPLNSATIGAASSGPDANGVTVNIDTAPNPDAVTINIPASNAVAGKLFGRLKATKP